MLNTSSALGKGAAFGRARTGGHLLQSQISSTSSTGKTSEFLLQSTGKPNLEKSSLSYSAEGFRVLFAMLDHRSSISELGGPTKTLAGGLAAGADVSPRVRTKVLSVVSLEMRRRLGDEDPEMDPSSGSTSLIDLLLTELSSALVEKGRCARCPWGFLRGRLVARLASSMGALFLKAFFSQKGAG